MELIAISRRPYPISTYIHNNYIYPSQGIPKMGTIMQGVFGVSLAEFETAMSRNRYLVY